MSTPEERIAAGQELRRRGRLSADQDAALSELELRYGMAVSPAAEQPAPARGTRQERQRRANEARQSQRQAREEAERGKFPIVGAIQQGFAQGERVSLADEAEGVRSQFKSVVPGLDSRLSRIGAPGILTDVALGLYGLGQERRAEQRGEPLPEIYTTGRDVSRAVYNKAQEDRPFSTFAGEFLASALYPAGTLRMGAPLLGQSAKLGAIGFGQGALYGYASGEGDTEQREQSAQTGALYGGGLGALMPGAAAAALPVARGIRSGTAAASDAIVNLFGGTGTSSEAVARQVAEAAVRRSMERSGMTPERIAELVEQFRDKPAVLAEVIGQDAINALTSLTRRPGRTAQAAQDVIEERFGAFGERATADVRGAARVPDEFIAGDLSAELAARRAAANPQYRKLYEDYSDDVTQALLSPDSTLAKILEAPALRSLMANADNQARSFAVSEGRSPQSVSAFETLDVLKRMIDDRIGTARKAGENSEVALFTGLKNRLVNELDEITGQQYAAVRAAGGEAPRLQSAAKLGDKWRTMKLPEFLRELGKVQPDDLPALQASIIGQMEDAIRKGQMRPGAFRTADVQSKVRAAFGDDAGDELIRRMTAEAELRETGARFAPRLNSVSGTVLENPPSQMLDDAIRLGAAGLRGDKIGITTQVINFMRRQGYNQRQIDEMGRLLLSNPEEGLRRLGVRLPGSPAPGGASGANLAPNAFSGGASGANLAPNAFSGGAGPEGTPPPSGPAANPFAAAPEAAGEYLRRMSLRAGQPAGPSERVQAQRAEWQPLMPQIAQVRQTADDVLRLAEGATTPEQVRQAQVAMAQLRRQVQEMRDARGGKQTPEDARIQSVLDSFTPTNDPVFLGTQAAIARQSMIRLGETLGFAPPGQRGRFDLHDPAKYDLTSDTPLNMNQEVRVLREPVIAPDGTVLQRGQAEAVTDRPPVGRGRAPLRTVFPQEQAPTDRTSRTRYAEGGADDVQPMGFGGATQPLIQSGVGSVGGSVAGTQYDLTGDGVIDERDVAAGALGGMLGLPAAMRGMRGGGASGVRGQGYVGDNALSGTYMMEPSDFQVSTRGWRVERGSYDGKEFASVVDANGKAMGVVPFTQGKRDVDIIAEMAAAKRPPAVRYPSNDTAESEEMAEALMRVMRDEEPGEYVAPRAGSTSDQARNRWGDASTTAPAVQAARFETPGSPQILQRIIDGDVQPTAEEMRGIVKEIQNAEFEDLVKAFYGDEKKARDFKYLSRKNYLTNAEEEELARLREQSDPSHVGAEIADVTDAIALRNAIEEIENGRYEDVLADAFRNFPLANEISKRVARGEPPYRPTERLYASIARRAIAEARLQGRDPGEVFDGALESYGNRFSGEDKAFMRQSITDLINMGATQPLIQSGVGSVGGSVAGTQYDLTGDGVIDERDVAAGALGGMLGLPAAMRGMRGGGARGVRGQGVRGSEQADQSVITAAKKAFDDLEFGGSRRGIVTEESLLSDANIPVKDGFIEISIKLTPELAAEIKKLGKTEITAADLQRIAPDIYKDSFDRVYFSETPQGGLMQEDIQIRFSNYDLNEVLSDPTFDAFVDPFVKPKIADRFREQGREQIKTVKDALEHPNHHVRAAAFRQLVENRGFTFRKAGAEGVNSEYVYIDATDEFSDIEPVKVRFSDHARQSRQHESADYNFYDGSHSADDIMQAIDEIEARLSNPRSSNLLAAAPFAIGAGLGMSQQEESRLNAFAQ